MIKIQYASDIHLEYPGNREVIASAPLVPCGDILILAGDMAYLGKDFRSYDFWDWASANYKQTIVCLGNHEFYGGYDLASMKDGEVGCIRHNVNYYYNGVVHLGDVDIIVSTLWSHIKEEKASYTEYSVTDFHRIDYGGHTLKAADFNAEHERCLSFVKKAVKESTAKTKIVVTHHVPSFKLVTNWFASHSYIGAFAVDLDDFIRESGVDYWIYGHSHWNIEERIGRTLCTCNQFGYVHHKEHLKFDRMKIIEV